MTDFRALCAELIQARDTAPTPSDFVDTADRPGGVIDRTRAALAEPEPEGPTDEELMKLLPEDLHKEFANWSRIYAEQAGIKPGLFRVVLNTHAVDFARAVLARWGSHPGCPDSSAPPVAELIAVVEAIQADPDDAKAYENDYRSGWIDACNQLLELLHRQRADASRL